MPATTISSLATDGVLPDDAPYLRNLAALWSADSDLARRVESADDLYPTEPARSGAPTIALPAPANPAQRLYLHSRYHPAEEADRLLAAIDFEQRYCFFVHGLGLGHHLLRLFERASHEAVIVVFEPDLVLLRTALASVDLSEAIDSRRVMIFCGTGKSDLFIRLQPHLALASAGAETIRLAPALRLRPDDHATAETWTEEFIAYARTSITTLVLNGRRTAENISRNLPDYLRRPDLKLLKDSRKGQPAIIVSAGPSLRRNQHLLPEIAGRAVMIAVQTTFRPLLDMGVTPDFVTTLDYHDISTRFFENLPPAAASAHLVAEPKASDKVLAMHPGAISVLGNEFAEGLIRELKLDKACLRAGATVAHLAFYLAEHLGCDPIIFVGQDLGFSDALAYAPGTSYEDVWRPELSRFCTVEMKQWEHIARDRRILRKIPDHLGRPMYTEERLYTYLQQFERDFLSTTTRIIDATEGGALKRGTTPMPLRQAIDTFCPRPLPPAVPAAAATQPPPMSALRDCLLARRAEGRKIADISRRTLPLLEEVRDHVADQARVNQLIARIDALRVEMDDLSATYDLIIQMSQQTELDRFRHDRAIAASRAEGLDRQRRQVRRDIDNVRAIASAADEFARLMDQILARINAPPAGGGGVAA